MALAPLRFRHEIIDPDPPGAELDLCLPADLDGDGRIDILIGGKQGDPNLFWYRNPDWTRFALATSPNLEAGGAMVDLTGNGRLDLFCGEQYNGNRLWWFENPDDPTGLWPRHLICSEYYKYHDQAVGDLDGDGRPELVFCSQRAGVLGYYQIPPDPRVEPWPVEYRTIVAEGMHDVEGLVVVDIDGDGVNELLAGPRIFRREGGRWAMHPFAPGFSMTRVAVGDLDGDGRLEIVLAEGETFPARLAVCHAPDYEPRMLREDLFHAHSLALADFDGSGRLDIFVAEMGLGRNDNARGFIYRNDGRGGFAEEQIWNGVPTHESKAADLTGNGRPDIIIKPYHPERRISVWLNET